MSPHAAALLATLAYPHPDVDLGDPQALQDLVAWLEHTKIRHYPADARAGLTSPANAAAWHAALTSYLSDLGSSLPAPGVPGGEGGATPAWDSATAAAVGEWLAGRAVALAYADVAEQCRDAVAEVTAVGVALDDADAAAGGGGGGPPGTAPFPDAADPAVAAAAEALAAAVRAAPPAALPPSATPAERTAAAVACASTALESTLLPAAEALGWEPAASPPTLPPPTTDTAATAAAIADALLPLGLPPGPGGPAGDRAAAVARWLLWCGLRAQQTDVDEAIAACQDFTARPRTDAKLGKVGR